MAMKKIRPATIIAAVIAVLSLLLGLTTRALWEEWRHHKRGHAAPAATSSPQETSSLPEAPDLQPDLAGGPSGPA
ncbi:MAG: hypothetical protein ACK4E3_02560 [Brevundimonas sp.]|jgi:hypothetical protein|uniref:hypothetical protein n=1 Tax=Brevundimonas sp. TaxID=1871086 RepID=UPI003919A55E